MHLLRCVIGFTFALLPKKDLSQQNYEFITEKDKYRLSVFNLIDIPGDRNNCIEPAVT